MNDESPAQKGPEQSSPGLLSSLSGVFKPGGADETTSQGMGAIKAGSSAIEAVQSAVEGDWAKSQKAALDASVEAPGISSLAGRLSAATGAGGLLNKMREAGNAYTQAQGAALDLAPVSKLNYGAGPISPSDLVKVGEMRDTKLKGEMQGNQPSLSASKSLGMTALSAASTPFAVGADLGGFTVDAIKNAEAGQSVRQENRVSAGNRRL